MKRLALPLGGFVLAALCLAAEYHAGNAARALAAACAGLAALCWAAGAGIRPAARLAQAAALPALGAGLFAAAMDPALKTWAVPQHAADLLRLSDVGAVTACTVLLGAALLSAVRGGRPLRPLAAAAALALPVLFNLLLALAAPAPMARLGAALSLHRWPELAPQIGRAGALWLFCEALIVGLGLLLDGRRPRGPGLHVLALGAAALAAFTPAIADLACGPRPAALPAPLRIAASVAGGALSEAGLWAITFLATGMILDALHGRRPTWRAARAHWGGGLGKGLVYGGVFMLLIGLAAQAAAIPQLAQLLRRHPLPATAALGALLFPLARTLVESFDGSAPFAVRLWGAARAPGNYLRGAIAGAGIGLALARGLPELASAARFGIGAAIGAAAYAGADALRDACAIARGRRRLLQSWRVYLLGALVGGFVGGALAWYFDAAQLAVVIEKFWRYAAVDFAAAGGRPGDMTVYPLFSKWGAISLGTPGGGVSLLYSESLAGVINWAIAAPLFSINLVLLTALFQRRLAPLREMLSREGLTGLVEQTVRVLRWGPWMAPIISSFLRQAPQPSWYNQDGAARSAVAVVQHWRLGGDAFRQWSRDVFLGLLAYDWLRILIWFDHMGVRVATLVNLSFVGADALDERAARFAGHAGRTRVIPEGVRRFLTWAPLLIPFYIPRGTDWDYVWSGAEQLAKTPGPLLPAVSTLLAGYAVAAAAAVCAGAVTARALAAAARR
ncbi:MAG: glycosyl transferase family 36, partial [Nevskia sp.]|nr:glycosyl transferase family 36 [Nevskia sp.]